MILKFILKNMQLKQVEKENQNKESSHTEEKNISLRSFTKGKNTSMD